MFLILFCGKNVLAAGLAACLLFTGCAAGTAVSSASAAESSASSQTVAAPSLITQEEAFQKAAASTEGLEGSTPAIVSQFIKENHPSPFTKMSEADFDAAIKELEQKWDSLPEDEAYYALQTIVAGLRDAHTSIGFPAAMLYPCLPMQLASYDGHWIILVAPNYCPELVGKELTAINGMDIGTIRERLLPILSYEVEPWADHLCCTQFLVMSNLKYAGAADKLDGASITAKDYLTGESVTVYMESVTKGLTSESISIYSPLEPTLMKSRRNYCYTLLDDGTLFIQYNTCYDDPDLPMQEFVSSIEDEFLAGPPKKIIVDMRQNTGGSSTVTDPLLDTLDQFVQDGSQLYCLIGPTTYSSGMMGALDLKRHGALLVGEPVGNILRFGSMKILSLPDGNTLYCSTMDFYQGARVSFLTDGLLLPDVEVVQTVPDFLAGIDDAVEYVQSLD